MSPFGVQYTTERGSPFLLRKSHSTVYVKCKIDKINNSNKRVACTHYCHCICAYVFNCARVVVWDWMWESAIVWLPLLLLLQMFTSLTFDEWTKSKRKMCVCCCSSFSLFLLFPEPAILSIHSISEVKFFIVVYNLHIQIRKQLLLLRTYI